MSTQPVGLLNPGDKIILEGETVEVVNRPLRYKRYGNSVGFLVRRADGRCATVGFDSDTDRVKIPKENA